MKAVILCDLDGMLANLDAEVMRRSGVSHWLDDDERSDAYDFALGQDGVFADLKPLPGALAAFSALRMIGDAYIVSAPSRNPDSATDKIRWCERHLGINRRRVILTGQKHLLRGDVFLDDWKDNLLRFREANPAAFIGTIHMPANAAAPVNFRAMDHTNYVAAWGALTDAVASFVRGLRNP